MNLLSQYSQEIECACSASLLNQFCQSLGLSMPVIEYTSLKEQQFSGSLEFKRRNYIAKVKPNKKAVKADLCIQVVQHLFDIAHSFVMVKKSEHYIDMLNIFCQSRA